VDLLEEFGGKNSLVVLFEKTKQNRTLISTQFLVLGACFISFLGTFHQLTINLIWGVCKSSYIRKLKKCTGSNFQSLSLSPPHPNNTKTKKSGSGLNDDLGPHNTYCSRDSRSILSL
jgi:hypothetical protein